MVTGTQTIKCTTYRAGRQMGKTLTLPLVWNKATAKPVLGNTQAGKILVMVYVAACASRISNGIHGKAVILSLLL